MELSVRERISHSLLQLGLGIVLLCIAGYYLSSHPAEWQSIKSSLDVVHQKITRLFTLGGATVSDVVSVQSQYTKAVSNFKEIIDSIRECDPDSSVITEYEAIYQSLLHTDLQGFEGQISYYGSVVGSAYQEMLEICKK